MDTAQSSQRAVLTSPYDLSVWLKKKGSQNEWKFHGGDPHSLKVLQFLFFHTNQKKHPGDLSTNIHYCYYLVYPTSPIKKISSF